MNFLRPCFTSLLALTVAGCGDTAEIGESGESGESAQSGESGESGESGDTSESGESGETGILCEACGEPWSLLLGGLGWSTVLDVAVDSDGDIIVLADIEGAGEQLGLAADRAGTTVVAGLDPSGAVLWATPLPPALYAGLALDAAGHVFLAGSSKDTAIDLGGGPLGAAIEDRRLMFLAEFDAAGQHVWSRGVATTLSLDYGQDYAEPTGIGVDAAGMLVVTGSFSGSLDFGAGDLDLPGNPLAAKVFVAVFDGAGEAIRSQRFGDQPDGNMVTSDTGLFVHDAVVAADGSVWLTGEVYGELHVGDELFAGHGRADGFVARLDPAGHPVFTRRFGGTDAENAIGLALAPDGGVVVTGFATGSVDFGAGLTAGEGDDHSPFVVALDANGGTRWAARPTAQGLTASGYGLRVGVDPEGEVIAVLGSFRSSGAIVTLDGVTGGELGRSTFVSTVIDAAEPILTLDAFALDPNGDLLIGGSLRGLVDLGSGPMVSEPLWGAGAVIARITRP